MTLALFYILVNGDVFPAAVTTARAHLRLGFAKSVLTAKSKAKAVAVAIYHATTKPLGRSAGRSSVAAAAYRAGVKLEDHRTAMVFDFTRRSGVVLAEIVAPAGAGELASDRAALWNAAEAAENRKDARTAREWILALPAELIAEQRADLARAFAHELVERYGVAVDVAIHAPSRGGDDRNHHAHVLTTTRVVVAGQLGEKASIELSDTKRRQLGMGAAADEICVVRERWASLVNAALDNADQSTRVDHRSLADQQAAAFERGDLRAAFALDRSAQKHVGVHATAMDRRVGEIHSERGQVRERAVAAGHRAAYSAEKRAERAVAAEMAEATAQARAESSPVTEAGRADSGPMSLPETTSCQARAESSPAVETIRADSSPTTEAGRADPGPVIPHEATMDQQAVPPRTADELRAEISRRSRTVDQRLDAVPELAPGRAKMRDLRIEHDQLEQIFITAKASQSEAAKQATQWRNKHPVRALLPGVLRPAAFREIEANLAGCAEQAEKVRERGLETITERAELRAALAPIETRYRGPIEAEVVADAGDLVALRAQLQALEAEQRQRQQVEQLAQLQRAELDQEQRQQREVAAARVAAFEAGRVSSPGAPHCLQQAFNEAHRAGLVNWDGIAIRGCAAALANGNTPAGCTAALVKWWPGAPTRAPELIEQAKAQVIVDRVRTAIEAGHEPATEGGRLLAATIKAAGDDVAARAAILPTYAAAAETVAADPALRDVEEKEKDRPAPGF